MEFSLFDLRCIEAAFQSQVHRIISRTELNHVNSGHTQDRFQIFDSRFFLDHNRDDRIIELLEMIELDESFMDRLPGELSGGQKQRICIARALAAEPEVIICDEVTSALDQIVQEGILKLLLRLQKELNITYLFITHDIAVVTAISDEIVVMFQGQVVEQGLKSKILAPPYPDYTQLLLSSVPEMDPDWLSNLVEERG